MEWEREMGGENGDNSLYKYETTQQLKINNKLKFPPEEYRYDREESLPVERDDRDKKIYLRIFKTCLQDS